MKLTIGTKTKKEILKELEQFRVGDWAKDILGKVKFSKQPQELELVIKKVSDFGFTTWTSIDDIYTAATKEGLELCPAEVGPYLRLAYDQPKNEWLIIAMEAIRGSFGRLDVFSVGHDFDGRWLDAHFGSPDDTWYPDCQFVFVSRKSLDPKPLSASPSDPLALKELDFGRMMAAAPGGRIHAIFLGGRMNGHETDFDYVTKINFAIQMQVSISLDPEPPMDITMNTETYTSAAVSIDKKTVIYTPSGTLDDLVKLIYPQGVYEHVMANKGLHTPIYDNNAFDK